MVKVTKNTPSFEFHDYKILVLLTKPNSKFALDVLANSKELNFSSQRHFRTFSVKIISPPIGLSMELMNFVRRFLPWI